MRKTKTSHFNGVPKPPKKKTIKKKKVVPKKRKLQKKEPKKQKDYPGRTKVATNGHKKHA